MRPPRRRKTAHPRRAAGARTTFSKEGVGVTSRTRPIRMTSASRAICPRLFGPAKRARAIGGKSAAAQRSAARTQGRAARRRGNDTRPTLQLLDFIEGHVDGGEAAEELDEDPHLRAEHRVDDAGEVLEGPAQEPDALSTTETVAPTASIGFRIRTRPGCHIIEGAHGGIVLLAGRAEKSGE